MDPARLDWRCKGAPPSAEGLTSDEVGGLGLRLTRDMMLPVAILRDSALAGNIDAMQAFADRIGARLCPHGKTSMSPELFAMQIAAGAWGMTAATAHHVRIYRRLGIGRVFLANQPVAPADLDWIAAELARDPGFDFYCLADSPAIALRLAAAAERAGLERPIQVLVETGAPQGRTGARGIADALAAARAIASAAPFLALSGVETFEGIRQTRRTARAEAAEMIGLAVAAAEAMAGEALFGAGPVMISAGGSAFLDLCSARLPDRIGGRPVEKVIRPGCYVTHDHGLYAALAEGAPESDRIGLRPALEVWGAVQSVPEPGVAIVGVGKRDVSSDAGLPLPIRAYRDDRGGIATDGLSVVELWDQHARLADPAGALAVGDLVGFGISHPCATFDRWRALFTAADDDSITGFVATIF